MSGAAAIHHGNPFPGLRPFLENEEHLFFGRESQVDALVGKLARTKFLAVVGASGSGKSSLVNCGLRPALHRGLMAAAGTAWRIAQFRPGGHPIRSLARAVAESGLFDKSATGAIQLHEIVEATLRMSSVGLVDLYEQAQLPAGTNLLVIVDQFEELFRYRRVGIASTSAGDERMRNAESIAFVNLLLAAMRQKTSPIYVVITMRSDFLGDCAQFAGLPEAINDGQYLVPRLTRSERRAVVAGPLAVGGAQVDPVLVTRLVNDVGDNPDQLSILQHALNRTWARWARARQGVVSIPHYEAVGTMAHALDQHADKAYGELSGHQQEGCARIFKALTDSGTDARGVRRPARLADLCAIARIEIGEATAIIDTFRKPSRSFLMPPLPEPVDADTVIDISHESLMRVWVRLIQWSDEEAQSAQLYRRLSETARLHAQGKAGPWRDPELQLALDWREKERPTAAWAAQYGGEFDRAMAFLALSERTRADEIRQKDEQQRQALEYEKASALAKEEKLRLALQLKSARRLRWLTAALTVLVVAAVGLSLWAYQQRLQAIDQASNARTQAERADSERSKAVESQRQAERALESVRQSLQALSTQVGKDAVESAVNPGVAALVPRVYAQYVDATDKAYAQTMNERIRQRGFTVLGLEYVPKAQSLPSTQVRYYKKADEPGATRLVQVLRDAGDSSARPVHLVKEENNPRIRQNHFEVWYAPTAGRGGVKPAATADESLPTYAVGTSAVSLEVVVGNGQASTTQVKLGDVSIPRDERGAFMIGQGPDLIGKTLLVTTLVLAINPSTTNSTLTFKLTGGENELTRSFRVDGSQLGGADTRVWVVKFVGAGQ